MAKNGVIGIIMKWIGGLITALIIFLISMALNGSSKANTGVQENKVEISAMKNEDVNLDKGIRRIEVRQEKLNDKMDELPGKIVRMIRGIQ